MPPGSRFLRWTIPLGLKPESLTSIKCVAFLKRLPELSSDEYRRMVIAAGLEFFPSNDHGGAHTHAEPGNEGTPDHGSEGHTHPPSESEPHAHDDKGGHPHRPTE